MTTISLRVENDLKTKIEELCESIGMNVSTFFTIYAKKAVKEQAIPFSLTSNEDIFYSKSNMEALQKSTKQIKEGKVITKTIKELEAIVDGKY
ncbi:MAG: type II toxin-antitoxin system RelB/DinJ family antitoxin [Lachnospiraceae bacterium]|nr:type II toxin-antitoxin system RelB/DinJ family antitoxin [Lachnospiraceae bacterium]